MQGSAVALNTLSILRRTLETAERLRIAAERAVAYHRTSPFDFAREAPGYDLDRVLDELAQAIEAAEREDEAAAEALALMVEELRAGRLAQLEGEELAGEGVQPGGGER